MSEPVSGSAAAASALTGASLYGLLTGTDYGVVFGAFAGAVFYVATAADLTLPRRTAYFVVSYFAGVYGSGLVGSMLASITHYSDKPLDALGAVLLSALAIKTLTFFIEQEPLSLLKRWGEETMVTTDLLVLTNVAASSMIVLRLMMFRKPYGKHNAWPSWLAYLIILTSRPVSCSISISTITGRPSC